MAFSPASKQTAFLNATDGLRRSSVKKCPNCGAEVTASNLSRHQKTKKCMSASNPPAYASSNRFNEKPPSMKQVCSRCGVEVRNSSMSRHKKTKKCMSTLDRQTPDFDMSMLENYADTVSDNQFQNVIADFDMSMLPESYSNLRPEEQDAIADFDMSMLPESYSNLRPEEQDAIADFDLSMLDTPDFYSKIRAIIGPSTADAPKFEPPVKRIHPDSSKIISILGPPPFEVPDKSDYSLHIPYSPVYHSPLHIPESPTYNVLSPTDVRAQIKPQKKPCPKCSKEITVSNMARHQKSQKCANYQHGMTYNERLKKMEIKPAPKNINMLVKKYPKRPREVKQVPKVNTNDIALEAMIRKPTRPQKIPTGVKKIISETPTSTINSENSISPTLEERQLLSETESPSTPHLVPVRTPEESQTILDEISEVQSAFTGRLKTYVIMNKHGIKDPKMFLEICKPLVVEKLQEAVKKKILR
ncbi:hypothetical protein J6590_086041 [Homalodisca vitripennis]|nr:hypothetical protein J6590_086041 [Homalodisca vitripennis]